MNTNIMNPIDTDMKTPFSIKGITKLVDENDIAIEFEVFNFTKSKNVDFSLKRSEFIAKMLKKEIVRNGGISMDENKLIKLVDYYVNNMLYAMYYDEIYADSVWCSHKALGWAVRDGVLEFDHNNILQADKTVTSQYRGRFDIEPQDTLENIKIMNGIPFAIDEFSLSKSKAEWTDFVYTLSNGFDKDRCSAGGAELQLTGSFQTVFVTNGETNILKKCNGNEGICARLFEIMLDAYTRNAVESDFIKETVCNNYGILTPLLAQELMCNSDKWNECRRFQYWIKSIRSH